MSRADHLIRDVVYCLTVFIVGCKAPSQEERLRLASHSARACVTEIRTGLPQNWSIERVLDQRVLADGWSSTPSCESLRVAMTKVIALLPPAHPLADFVFPGPVYLSENPDDLAHAARVFRRVDAILSDLRLEHQLEPLPLQLAGEANPALPKPVQLPRWPSPAEDYRTITWPLFSGVIVLEIVRQLSGQGDCPKNAPGRQCHRYAATWVGWNGAMERRAELEVADQDTYWLHWDAAPDGRLYALGVAGGKDGAAPAIATYPPRHTTAVITRLPAELSAAKRLEALADGVVLRVDGSSFFAPWSETTLTFTEGAKKSLDRQRASTTPITLIFEDGSTLVIQQRRRILQAQRQHPDGRREPVQRIAELYGALGHLNYAAADRAGWIALAFTHPSARATSLLLSADGGRTWGPSTRLTRNPSLEANNAGP